MSPSFVVRDKNLRPIVLNNAVFRTVPQSLGLRSDEVPFSILASTRRLFSAEKQESVRQRLNIFCVHEKNSHMSVDEFPAFVGNTTCFWIIS